MGDARRGPPDRTPPVPRPSRSPTPVITHARTLSRAGVAHLRPRISVIADLTCLTPHIMRNPHSLARAVFATKTMRALWPLPLVVPIPTFRRTLAPLCCSAVLPTRPLPYRGVCLDLSHDDAESFAARIGPSIEHWRDTGRQSVMLRLPIELAGLASTAAKVRSASLTQAGSHFSQANRHVIAARL